MRVLDLTRLQAAYAGRVMAEAGAAVVRVEPVGAVRPRADELYEYFNAGKASVTLDPRHPAGAALLQRLVAWADVVVESQPAAYWEAAGTAPAALVAAHPALVLVSVEDDDPTLDARTVELLASARSGLMSITGEPDGPPLLVGGHAALALVGLFAAIGAYGALAGRRVSGRGQWVRVRTVDVLYRLMEQALLGWTMQGQVAGRVGNKGGATAINGTFPCRDGHVAISVSANAETWQRFLAILEPSGLAAELQDPALLDELERRRRRPEVFPIVERWTRQHTRAEVVAACLAGGVAAAPVNTVADLFADPQLQARGFWRATSGPGGEQAVPAGAVMNALSRPGALRPAPTPGADNLAVYGRLGYDAATLRELAASGAI